MKKKEEKIVLHFQYFTFIESFDGTFDERDLNLLTDDQLLMAMGAITEGVEQMAVDVSKAKDVDKAADLLDTMDNLLGRFGNMSAVSPQQFTNLAQSKLKLLKTLV